MLNLTLTQLQYIVAVDTHRHFVSAAEASFVTQPTLSMQIKKLEAQLDLVIFDRSKQPIVPTPAGAEIIAQARTVLREAERIGEIVQRAKGVLSGDLKIGIIPTLAPYLLPRFLGSFLNAYPEIHLQVKELETEEQITALHKDEIDTGLLVTPLNEKGIEEMPLFYEEFRLYVGQGHPASARPIIPPPELKEEHLWLLSEGHCFRNQAVNLCSAETLAGAPLDLEYESGSLETLIKIVNREGGSTLLPELAADEIQGEAKDRVKVIGPPPPVREVSLVFSRNFAKRRMIDALAEKIKESVPEHMRGQTERAVVEWR